MSERGEELIVVATVDPVEKGQEFRRIPPHMTVIGWFSFPESHYHQLQDSLAEQFAHTPVFQETVGGEPAFFGTEEEIAERKIKVRKMLHVEEGPWFALHALIQNVGSFPEDDPFTDVFSPHVTKTEAREIMEDEHVAFPTVALFSKDPTIKIRHVREVYPQQDRGTV